MAPEPEAVDVSDQVCESATLHVPEGILVENEGMDRSPTHTSATEGELPLTFGIVVDHLKVDYFLDCPESSRWFCPALPLLSLLNRMYLLNLLILLSLLCFLPASLFLLLSIYLLLHCLRWFL